MTQPKHFWLQPGTRLHMIVRREHDDDSVFHEYDRLPELPVWEIWTATNSRTGDSSQWHGTFLRLMPDGTMFQVHRDPHGVENVFQVMD